MVSQELFDRSPIRLFDKITGGMKAGELALLTARKGLGKTSVLVQFGVDALLKDKQIVHVSFDQHSSNVISWYEDILAEIAKKRNISNISDIKQELVRKRIILNFNQDTISLTHVAATIRSLGEGGIKPDFIIVDGFDFDKAGAEELSLFAEFVRSQGIYVWFSANGESAVLKDTLPDEKLKLFDIVLHLEPVQNQISVLFLKLRSDTNSDASLKLDSKTLLMTAR